LKLCSLLSPAVKIFIFLVDDMLIVEQAKPETVDKVCEIVKKQLALADTTSVTGESKFSDLGADSLDTV